MRRKVHYLEIYERHFGRFRGQAVRMLEIGGSRGGSLDLWRAYFGAATIFGVDVAPACAARVEPPKGLRAAGIFD